MAKKGDSDESTYLTPADMRGWLREETRNVLKECDLRIKDATDFVTAYLGGQFTWEETEKRLSRYENRWHSALGGVYASAYKNDEELLAAMDKAERELQKSARPCRERVRRQEQQRQR
jgi:ribosome-associated translation inhibitor RaiA